MESVITDHTMDFFFHNNYFINKKASIRWQDSARRQFQAGVIGDVGL